MANLLNLTSSIALGELLEPTRILSIIQATNASVFNFKSGEVIQNLIYRTPRLPVFLWSKDIRTLINFPIAPEKIKIDKSPSYQDIEVPGYHTNVRIYKGMSAKTISFTAYFDKSANSSFSDNGTGEILTYIPGFGCLDVIASFERLMYPMDKPRGAQSSVKISEVFSDIASSARESVTKMRGYSDPQNTDFYIDTGRQVSTASQGGTSKQVVNVVTGEKKVKVQTNYNFYPNPVCYFFAGVRYWKCLLESADVTEVRYNKMYVPTHLEVSVKLYVIEEDSSYREGDSVSSPIRSDGFFTQEKTQREVFSNIGTVSSVVDQISYVVSTVI